DASGSGEGETLLGQATITTDGNGNATFSADVPQTLFAGQLVTATATAMNGTTPLSTSEFSNTSTVTGLLPTIVINDFSVAEGDSGVTNATVDAVLEAPITQPVTFSFSTADGTATAPGDYIAQSSTITFQPGETDKQITIKVNGDTKIEADE